MTSSELSISRVILYVRDIEKVAAFYIDHFGFQRIPGDETGWLELAPRNRIGSCIALHQASTAQKKGSEMKIVFSVRDIRSFILSHAASGLKFGKVHEFNGINFANAKDPAGNSIQISNRGT